MNLNSIRISTVRGRAPYKYPPHNTMPKSPGTNSNPLRISWSITFSLSQSILTCNMTHIHQVFWERVSLSERERECVCLSRDIRHAFSLGVHMCEMTHTYQVIYGEWWPHSQRQRMFALRERHDTRALCLLWYITSHDIPCAPPHPHTHTHTRTCTSSQVSSPFSLHAHVRQNLSTYDMHSTTYTKHTNVGPLCRDIGLF